MSWGTWLLIGMLGLTSAIAAIIISAIIVLVFSETGLLLYRRLFSSQGEHNASTF